MLMLLSDYGTDKPDIRFGLELKDLSDIAGNSNFTVFRSAIQNGGKVKGISLPGCSIYSNKQIEELTDLAKSLGAKGLVTIALSSECGENLEQLSIEKIKSIAAKYLTLEQIKEMASRCGAKSGDMMIIVAGDARMVNKVLSEMRQANGVPA